MAYLRFDLSAVWNDLHLMSQARSSGLYDLEHPLVDRERICRAASAGAARVPRQHLDHAAPAHRDGAVVFVGGALLAGHQRAAERLSSQRAAGDTAGGTRPRSQFETRTSAGPLPQAGNHSRAAGPGLLRARILRQCERPGLCASRKQKESARIRGGPFHAPHLASLLLYDVPDGTDADRRSNGRVYVDYVNDGIDLLRKFSTPHDTVVTLDMVNPFPYALLRPPAHGGSPALAFNHTFNDQHKPSADWLFGSADIVMVPKRPASSEPDARALFRNYLPDIESEFQLRARSRNGGGCTRKSTRGNGPQRELRGWRPAARRPNRSGRISPTTDETIAAGRFLISCSNSTRYSPMIPRQMNSTLRVKARNTSSVAVPGFAPTQ